jgi:hypothetical protein
MRYALNDFQSEKHDDDGGVMVDGVRFRTRAANSSSDLYSLLLKASLSRLSPADIVCRTCGAEEGVFLVLRAESETAYECQACADQRRLGREADAWMRRLLLFTP